MEIYLAHQHVWFEKLWMSESQEKSRNYIYMVCSWGLLYDDFNTTSIILLRNLQKLKIFFRYEKPNDWMFIYPVFWY